MRAADRDASEDIEQTSRTAEKETHDREPLADIVSGESRVYSEAEKDFAMVAIADSSVASVMIEHGPWMIRGMRMNRGWRRED